MHATKACAKFCANAVSLCVNAVQVNAQVMLLKNLDLSGNADQMLVNGSRGVVVGFVLQSVCTSFQQANCGCCRCKV